MKRLTMAAKIRAMKVGGEPLHLETVGDRAKCLAISKAFKDGGFINFKVVTTPNKNGGFSATAVPE